MSAQSAPSDVATTDVAWHAPLQNSRPTLTHLEAGAGAMYGGGASRCLCVCVTELGCCPALCVIGVWAAAVPGFVDIAALLLGPIGGECDAEVEVEVNVDVPSSGASGVMGVATATRPGGAPLNITSPPWSHSNSQSADTVTSADMSGLRRAV